MPDKIVMNDSVHRLTLRVLYGDTDSGGVVYYGNYLRFFEVGRTEFMRSNNLTYKSLEDAGFILPVVECHSRYKASAKYDDLLIIETSMTDVKPVSCRFNYRILRRDDEQLLVKGYTTHASIDRDGKLAKLPMDIVAKLKKISRQPE